MSDHLEVFIESQYAGRLSRFENNRLTFTYDEQYLNNPNATPLSVSMPLREFGYDDKKISPWLWGLLPDSEAVLQRWAREFSISAASPFAFLATPIGLDCAGAVQFCDTSEIEALQCRQGSVQWLNPNEFNTIIDTLATDGTKWLQKDFNGRFSLGGAQTKTALLKDGPKWGVPSGSMPTTHIIKPAVSDLEFQALNEHLCLKAAGYLNISSCRTKYLETDQTSAIVVKRFDRLETNEGWRRVHQEDFCQASSVHPARKYQSDGGPSVNDVLTLIKDNVTQSAAGIDRKRFIDALLYNWLIAGTDAHAKNYTLLLSGATVRMAPLYDVASFLPYDTTNQRKISFAMKLGTGYKVAQIDRPGLWSRFAEKHGLEKDVLLQRALQLTTTVGHALELAIADTDLSEAGSGFAQRLLELISTRALTCEKLL